MDLNKLWENALLCAEDEDAVGVTEEALVATRTLITAVGHKLLMSEMGYTELLCSFATKLRSARRESKCAARNLAVRMAKVGDIEFKLQLFADDSGNVGDLQKPLSAKEVELASTNSSLEVSEGTLKSKHRECVESSPELGSDRAAVGRGKRLIHDFAEFVGNGYISLVRTQAASYQDGLNDVLADAQFQDEYVCDYRVRVGEGGHSIHHGDTDSDEQHDSRTPSAEGDGDIVVVRTPIPPSYFSAYFFDYSLTPAVR